MRSRCEVQFGGGRMKLRTQDEIQRAHDVLMALIDADDIMATMPIGNGVAAAYSLDVLCWVLGHDSNDLFSKLLARVESKLAEYGQVKRKGIDENTGTGESTRSAGDDSVGA